MVSYGALRCESVTGDVYEPSSACEGHMITIALSPMNRPNPLRNRNRNRPDINACSSSAVPRSPLPSRARSRWLRRTRRREDKEGERRRGGTRRTLPSSPLSPVTGRCCYVGHLYAYFSAPRFVTTRPCWGRGLRETRRTSCDVAFHGGFDAHSLFPSRKMPFFFSLSCGPQRYAPYCIPCHVQNQSVV
jgi:hypothetical protein